MTKTADLRPPPLLTLKYIILLTANLFMISGFSAFFILPVFILQIGGTKTDIGLLMGVMPLAAVLVRPWISRCVDRIGRIKSVAAGCLLMSAVSLAHILFQQPIDGIMAVLIVLRLLFGIGFALGLVAAFTLAIDLTPEGRLNEGIGIFGTTGLLGMALGPMAAEWIINRYTFTAMFAASAASLLFALICLIRLQDQYRFQADMQQATFLKTLRHPSVFRMALIGLSFGIGYAAHGAFVAPYANSKGLLASVYFIAYSVAAILSRLVGGRIGDRIGASKIIPFALTIAALGFWLLTLTATSTGLFTAGFTSGIGHGLFIPGFLASGVHPIANCDRGKATGVLTGSVDSGLFIGAILLGTIGEWGGYTAIFYATVVFMVSGIVLFYATRGNVHA